MRHLNMLDFFSFLSTFLVASQSRQSPLKKIEAVKRLICFVRYTDRNRWSHFVQFSVLQSHKMTEKLCCQMLSSVNQFAQTFGEATLCAKLCSTIFYFHADT